MNESTKFHTHACSGKRATTSHFALLTTPCARCTANSREKGMFLPLLRIRAVYAAVNGKTLVAQGKHWKNVFNNM